VAFGGESALQIDAVVRHTSSLGFHEPKSTIVAEHMRIQIALRIADDVEDTLFKSILQTLNSLTRKSDHNCTTTSETELELTDSDRVNCVVQ